MASSLPTSEPEVPRHETAQLRAHNRCLELRVMGLETQLFGRKSERCSSPYDANKLEWEQLLRDAQALAPTPMTPVASAPE